MDKRVKAKLSRFIGKVVKGGDYDMAVEVTPYGANFFAGQHELMEVRALSSESGGWYDLTEEDVLYWMIERGLRQVTIDNFVTGHVAEVKGRGPLKYRVAAQVWFKNAKKARAGLRWMNKELGWWSVAATRTVPAERSKVTIFSLRGQLYKSYKSAEMDADEYNDYMDFHGIEKRPSDPQEGVLFDLDKMGVVFMVEAVGRGGKPVEIRH